jgi:hypothetical protein
VYTVKWGNGVEIARYGVEIGAPLIYYLCESRIAYDHVMRHMGVEPLPEAMTTSKDD